MEMGWHDTIGQSINEFETIFSIFFQEKDILIIVEKCNFLVIGSVVKMVIIVFFEFHFDPKCSPPSVTVSKNSRFI